MPKYAIETEVSPERTLSEIREVLKRYNATGFGFMERPDRIDVGFQMFNRRVRFTVKLPEFSLTNKAGRSMGQVQAREAHEKAIRQRWRALLLVIKAKLESVESGVETFEEAFLAQLVLPNGQTMYEHTAAQIERAYLTGQMPPLLPSGE